MINTLNTNQLKKDIAEGRTQKVISKLLMFTTKIDDKKLRNEILHISGRWEEYSRDKRMRTESNERLNLQKSQIDDSLLQLLDEIEELKTETEETEIKKDEITEKIKVEPKDVEHKEKPEPRQSKWVSRLAILAAIITVLAGITEITGYSLKDIFASINRSLTNNPTVIIDDIKMEIDGFQVSDKQVICKILLKSEKEDNRRICLSDGFEFIDNTGISLKLVKEKTDIATEKITDGQLCVTLDNKETLRGNLVFAGKTTNIQKAQTIRLTIGEDKFEFRDIKIEQK